MSKPNVALSSLVTQAWDQLQGQVLKEIRQRIEEWAEAERETRLGRAHHARGGASPWRRWGYRVRKVLLTPWKRRGFTQALRQVVIDDGDPWIWKISEEVFPQALQIVDRYHVKEHLSQVAKALYGQVETAIAGLNVGTKNRTRAAGGVSPGRWPVMRPAHWKPVTAFSIWSANRHRMRYPEFHAQHLCTSSGVLEAGCK